MNLPLIKDFNQIWVSKHGVEFFEDGVKLRWGLDEYHDETKPAVFFGMYHNDDLQKMMNHSGPKIVIWGGNDMQSKQLNFVSELQKTQKIWTWAYPGEFSNILSSYNIDHKKLYIALKDYSNFKPIKLGENIYVYKGVHGNRPGHYKWNEIVNPLIDTFGSDRVIYANHLPMGDLIQNVYKNCFAYVKPNPKGGCTTMWELGHMGIKTIGKSHERLGMFREYSDLDNLISLILEESNFIGTIRTDVSDATKQIFTGEEWLTLDFWENNIKRL
jgi:hypothetical protein